MKKVKVADPVKAADLDVDTRACRFCQAPVPQLHPGQVREFCDNRHRAAFRSQEMQKALGLAIEAMEEMADAMEAAQARMAGARQLLKKFQKKGGGR